MPQFSFGQINTPFKLLDVGDEPAFVSLQVLDASTLHYAKNRETLIDAGAGAAAPNNFQGLQIKAAQNVVSFWLTGELWALSDTLQGLIEIEIMLQKKGGCGCGGGCGGEKNPTEIP